MINQPVNRLKRFISIATFSIAMIFVQLPSCSPKSILGVPSLSFVDQAGHILNIPQMKTIDNFHGGFALVHPAESDNFRFIDTKGRYLGLEEFCSGLNFCEGWAVVSPLATCKSATPFTFLGTNGSLMQHSFTKANSFNEGCAVVQVSNKFGLIDKTGSFILSPSFDFADAFMSGGMLGVRVGNLWGFVNRSGKIVIKPQYLAIRRFKDGLAGVQMSDKKWTYIDLTGRSITSEFDAVSDFQKSIGLFAIRSKNGKDLWGAVGRNGKIILPPKYERILLSEEIILAKAASGYRFFNSKGHLINKKTYPCANIFFGGKAAVLEKTTAGMKYGFIDRSGETVIQPQYDEFGIGFLNGFASVAVGTKENLRFGFIKENGQWLIAPRFLHAGGFSDGLAPVILKRN